MKKINNLTKGILVLILILNINFVFAFGAISGYNTENPFTIYAGESKDLDYNIYPTVQEGNLKIKAIITSGADIAEIIDSSNIYDATPDKAGLVHLKVEVPANVAIGTEYIVKLSFVNANAPENQGMVGLTTQSESSFKVVVVEKPAETPAGISTTTIIYWVIGIIVVIAIIWFVMKKKNE